VHGVVETWRSQGRRILLRLQGGALVRLALVKEVQPEARRIVVERRRREK